MSNSLAFLCGLAAALLLIERAVLFGFAGAGLAALQPALLDQQLSIVLDVPLEAGEADLDRIDQIDGLLEIRQERLLQEFIQMESLIGQLQSQGDALTALSQIATQQKNSG